MTNTICFYSDTSVPNIYICNVPGVKRKQRITPKK